MKPLIYLTLLGAALLAGCGAPKQPAKPPVQSQAPADKRVALSPPLQGVLQILRVHSQSASGGYLQAEITVKNLSKKLCRVSYNVQWLGSKDETLRLPMTVVPWALLGGETSSMTLTAPSPMARDFRLEFVPAN